MPCCAPTLLHNPLDVLKPARFGPGFSGLCERVVCSMRLGEGELCADEVGLSSCQRSLQGFVARIVIAARFMGSGVEVDLIIVPLK